MKKFMLIASITTLLVACGEDKQTENQQTASTVTAVSEQPKILTYIPADTPLLITSGLNPEQYPDRYLEVMEANMEGAVNYIRLMMDKALAEKSNAYDAIAAELEEGENTDSADPAEPSKSDLMKQKAKTFVDQWFLDENFGKIGMKMGETQLAIYMVDLFPVIRIKLSDGHQIEAMLADLQTQFEVQFTTSDVSGVQVRELAADNMTVFIATHDDYLVVSGAPSVIKDQMIGQLVGTSLPTTSLASDASLMQQVKQAHGYTMDDLLVLDIEKIADHFINPAKHNSAMVNFLQIEDNMLSPACKTEISAMFANAPRLVAGNKTLSNDTINASFVWEMESTMSQDMATLAGRIPHGNPDAAMSVGMSFDLLNAKNLASKYVSERVANPYACEHFTDMNDKMAEFQAKLSQPIPPFVGNFKGFNFSLDELKLNMDAASAANPNPKDMIESLKTQVFLAVDETEALLGMAQMMVPQLQEVDIKTDGSLITLADKVPMISGKDIPLDIANLYAAVSSDTIGFSMGHEGGGALSKKVNDEGQAALLTFSASADGYKDLLEQIFSMAEMPNMPAELKEELKMQKEFSLSMLYWKNQVMSMTFTDKGFTTDINITY